MRAVVLAYSNIGCVGMRALLRHGFEIVAVFTHRDNPQETIWFDSVAELAATHHLPVFAPEDINHPMWVEKIRESRPDILFSFYYRQLIRTEILDIPNSIHRFRDLGFGVRVFVLKPRPCGRGSLFFRFLRVIQNG